MDKLPIRLLSVLTLTCFFVSICASPVLAAITYTYDQNGNMTSNGTNCYEYNEANQLKKVKNCSNNQTIAEYIYDSEGTRIIKKEYENGVLKATIYSPADEYQTKKQATNSATQNTTYYKANDEIIAQKNPDGSITYHHNDHLGSNSISTDQTGAVAESTKYEPYGEVKSGGTQSKFQYTGQEKDQESGLNYYGARYYDPHIQRFTQADDIIQDPYNPQSLNKYSYVWNNPLRYTDPTGNIVDTIADIFFIGWDIYDIVRDPGNKTNWIALGADAGATLVPGVTGVGLGIKLVEHGGDAKKVISLSTNVVEETHNAINKALKNVSNSPVTQKYVRPSGATTKEQRQFVQGKSCVNCGQKSSTMVADHKDQLVIQHYTTGKIDTTKMKSVSAVRPQCINCSRIQGGILSNFSKKIKSFLKPK